MNMIEVKTAELSGAALDWTVAMAAEKSVSHLGKGVLVMGADVRGGAPFKPSIDWSQGGPLIQENHVDLHFDGRRWWAQADTAKGHAIAARDDGPLIAACRAICAAKLGDTVQVPAELLP